MSSDMCSGDTILRVQNHTCFVVEQQCSPGACIDTGNVRCAATCSDVKLAYAEARKQGQAGVVSGRAPLEPGPYNGSSTCEPGGCVVTPGHCELGLDTCWYLGPPIEELERLAELYVELDCPADLTCDCAAPPSNVSCEMSKEGFEIWGRSGKFSHACVIH